MINRNTCLFDRIDWKRMKRIWCDPNSPRRLNRMFGNPNSPKLYCVFLWAKYGLLEATWTGDVDDSGHPLTVYHSDHNGEYESYSVVPWYKQSTGKPMAYSFNKAHAEYLVRIFNREFERGES